MNPYFTIALVAGAAVVIVLCIVALVIVSSEFRH